LQRALVQRGGLSKVRCLAARKEPDVEIEVHLGEFQQEPEWTYAIGITQEVRGYRQPVLRYERVSHRGSSVLERPNQEDRVDPLRRTQTHLEQISANAQFRDVAKFLESVHYLHLVPQLLRHPELFQGTNGAEDSFGRSFLEQVAKTPEKTRKSRLRKIENALRATVPHLKNLVDTKDEAGVPHLEALYEHWRPKAGRQREDQFSDGTLRLIGLFWSLLDGDSPLLLEEPELSLHSAIVGKLPGLFHRLQAKRRRQLIISTHSWDMLGEKGISGDEVVLLTPNPEGTQVQLAASIEQVRLALQSGLSIADVALPLTKPPSLYQLDMFE
jgi:predicted ATPase